MQNEKFDVQDMHCGSCVRHVTEALRRLDGVEVRQVAVGSADVSFDPGKTSANAIAAALAEAGYPATAAEPGACPTKPGQGRGGCCG